MFLKAEMKTKVWLKYLVMLKEVEKFGFLFWKLNNKEKYITDTFSHYKLTSKLCLVYFEVKLQQNRCAC